MTAGVQVGLVDHDDSFTGNLAHLIGSVTGVLPLLVPHRDPDALARLADRTHVVLSPGPGHPARAVDFALGRAVFDLGRPVLGVCLGMQALVVAYGGEVGRVEPAHGRVARIEHDGTGLFAGIPQGFAAVRYHSLAALSVPEPLVVTATSDGIPMGVRHRSLPLAGVQFHPESILSEHGAALVANFLEGR